MRLQLCRDQLHAIIHKKPNEGHMSAVTGLAEYTWHEPDAPEFADLRRVFETELPNVRFPQVNSKSV